MKTILALGFIAIAAFVFLGFTNPRFKATEELRTEQAEYVDANNQADELIKQREELVGKYTSLPSAAIQRIDTMIPDAVDTVRLIIDVNAVAAKYGMTMLNVSVGAVDERQEEAPGGAIGPTAEPFGVVRLSFNVSASYERFRAFIAELEQSLRIVDVTSISFGQANPSTGLTTYTVGIQTYWLK